jgi:hypothetical protein
MIGGCPKALQPPNPLQLQALAEPPARVLNGCGLWMNWGLFGAFVPRPLNPQIITVGDGFFQPAGRRKTGIFAQGARRGVPMRRRQLRST